MKSLTPLILLPAILLVVAGCASPGYEKACNTSSSLEKDARRIEKGNVQLDAVLATLSDLASNPAAEMGPQFKKFSASVDKLDLLDRDVTSHVTAMQKDGAAYFHQWDVEIAKIQNEDIRTRSADRKAVVSSQFSKLKASYVQAKADFDPFMSDLKDIRTALAMDLTAGGIASVNSPIMKANKDVLPLHQSLDSLATDFKQLGVSISSSTPAK